MRDLKRSSSCSRETKKIRKILNEEVKLGIHHSDSETEDVDVHGELHALSHYMNNREEMIEQMFSIIKGDKLMKMLPPILKDVPLDELKADCLIHLLGMSKQRISAILDGREINSSSDSETHSDSSSPRRKARPFVKPIIIKQEGCSDISDNSEEVILIDPDLELCQSSVSSKNTKDNAKSKSKKRHKKDPQPKNKKILVSQTMSKSAHKLNIQEVEEDIDTHESSADSTNNNEDKAPAEGKTLLEILELEMRARAIRALLHKNDSPERQENTNQPEILLNDSEKSSVEVEKIKTTKVKPVRNFRKKKRKNDDVIVITPKVVTIDLTDENYTIKKNAKDISTGKKIETRSNESTKENSFEVGEITNKVISIDCNNKGFDLTEVEQGLTKEDAEKEKTFDNNEFTSSESSRSKQSVIEDLKKTNFQKSNWAQRWLESKEVKKVVSTSKICGNIRKRIKNAKLAKLNKGPLQEDKNKPNQKGEVESQEIEGRVDEYQLLSKLINPPNPNANTSNVCNSENILISNERNSDDKIESKCIETCSTVDQVQDVTSTKCESPSTICQENVLCESRQEIFTGDSNSNSCLDNSTSNLTKPDNQPDGTSKTQSNDEIALKNYDCSVHLNYKGRLNDPEPDILNSNNEKQKHKTPHIQENQYDKKQFESPYTNLVQEVDHLKCSPKTDIISEPTPSLETENIQHIHQPNEEQMTNSDFIEEFKKSSLETSFSDIKCCDPKLNPCEIKSPSPLIEPETLEINITDEDRDIDSICNERFVLDSTNTENKTV